MHYTAEIEDVKSIYHHHIHHHLSNLIVAYICIIQLSYMILYSIFLHYQFPFTFISQTIISEEFSFEENEPMLIQDSKYYDINSLLDSKK